MGSEKHFLRSLNPYIRDFLEHLKKSWMQGEVGSVDSADSSPSDAAFLKELHTFLCDLLRHPKEQEHGANELHGEVDAIIRQIPNGVMKRHLDEAKKTVSDNLSGEDSDEWTRDIRMVMESIRTVSDDGITDGQYLGSEVVEDFFDFLRSKKDECDAGSDEFKYLKAVKT